MYVQMYVCTYTNMHTHTNLHAHVNTQALLAESTQREYDEKHSLLTESAQSECEELRARLAKQVCIYVNAHAYMYV